MAQSLSKVYLHIIFSTKHFESIISNQIAREVQAYIVTTLSKKGVYTEEIFINPDHLHILCVLPRTMTIAQLVSAIKTPSSVIIKQKGIQNFSWQDGYASFSVSSSRVHSVKKYIINQPEHHKQNTFKEELRLFFKEYDIEFDERYVWD
ncbi:transposase [Labilibacter marinus]|uniref:transposase n=1 Tax=Labilibacter marinus TaxID=1477105 RepID=UPI000832F441|nr:transposase [Labilibacter marinus]